MTRWWIVGPLVAGLAILVAWELTGAEVPADKPAPALRVTPTLTQVAPQSTLELFSAAAATALARPLFSHDRRPPVQRQAPAPPALVEETPRLAGIVIAPSGRRAIFAEANGRSRSIPEGGQLGHLVVKIIGPGEVAVTSPEGDRVLRPSFVKTEPSGARRSIAATAEVASPADPARTGRSR